MSSGATETAGGSGGAGLPDSEALELYGRMLLIRRFEDSIQSLFQKGEVQGTTHLYSDRKSVV